MINITPLWKIELLDIFKKAKFISKTSGKFAVTQSTPELQIKCLPVLSGSILAQTAPWLLLGNLLSCACWSFSCGSSQHGDVLVVALHDWRNIFLEGQTGKWCAIAITAAMVIHRAPAQGTKAKKPAADSPLCAYDEFSRAAGSLVSINAWIWSCGSAWAGLGSSIKAEIRKRSCIRKRFRFDLSSNLYISRNLILMLSTVYNM